MVEGESRWGELDARRETRRGLEDMEEGGVCEEEFGGSGREVEVGFQERSDGYGEGFGGV